MNIRGWLFILVVALLAQNTFAKVGYGVYKLPAEPLIRIGLATNAGSVSITTTDPTLVAETPGPPMLSPWTP